MNISWHNIQRSLTADTILVADDDEMNRAILKNIFNSDYRILEASDGKEALDLILQHKAKICAVLLDVMMPVMNGLELLNKMMLLGLSTEIPVFLITSEFDTRTLRTAYGLGAMDVIQKPIISFITERRIKSVIELFQARKRLAGQVDQLQQETYRQRQHIVDLNEGMIETLATAIEFRSIESGEHVQRIRTITRILLTETPLGAALSMEEIRHICLASVMHDVGKIAIPDAILNKPDKLTADEFEIMKAHTSEGAHLLEHIPQMKQNVIFPYACDIALHHHERWDGRGYPDGLKGDQISIWAQVVSIADVYDALVSPRIYKAPIPHEQAVEMIRSGACGCFNPELIDHFTAVEADFRYMYQKKAAIV